MIVGVHQPNFFPYEGILDKIRRCDRFVLLGHAQFSPGNYHNRFDLLGRWYTMSVNHALEPLAAKRYRDCARDWATIKRRIHPRYAAVLDGFDDCVVDRLVETNAAIIRRICERVGIQTEIVMDYPTDLGRTERLVDLCRHYGATAYLSGASGPKYLDFDLFGGAGIDVAVHDGAARRAAVEVLAA